MLLYSGMSVLSHHFQGLHHQTRHHLRNALIPHSGNEYHPHALRRPALHIAGAVFITVKIIAAIFISFYANEAKVTSVTSPAIISLTNQTRQDRGISPLKANALLQKAAEAKARDMTTKGYFSHFSPSNVSPWHWFQQAGYRYTYAGENLAIDFSSSESVIEAWLDSPTHRANLLSARYKEIGVAAMTGQINGAQSLVIVQLFGAPTASATAKKSTRPRQTPAPSIAKQNVAKQTPVVKALSSTPPAAPTIESPAPDSVVRTESPEIIGQGEAGSQIVVRRQNEVVGQAAVSSSGTFSVLVAKPLSQGKHELNVRAEARGLSSQDSTIRFSLDSLPPEFSLEQSYVVPSLMSDGYHVFVSVPDDVSILTAVSGTVRFPLQRLANGTQYGHVLADQAGPLAGVVQIEAADAAGNQSSLPLIEADRFTTGVVAATGGPGTRALYVLFFSRTFLMVFFVLIFSVAALNVTLNWQRRHHPALLGMALLLYVTGALILM